jgi:hypothetical protein
MGKVRIPSLVQDRVTIHHGLIPVDFPTDDFTIKHIHLAVGWLVPLCFDTHVPKRNHFCPYTQFKDQGTRMGTVKEVYYLQKDTNSKYEYKVLYNDGMSIVMAHDLIAQLYSTRRIYDIIPPKGEKSKTSTSSLLDIYMEAPIEDMNY